MNDGLVRIMTTFEEHSGLHGIDYEVRERVNGDVLILQVAHPTERLFSILERIRHEAGSSSEDPPFATLKKTSKSNLLTSAEGQFLLRTLSESLNINRHSFKDDFFSRYTKSVFGAEEQIAAAANHIVYGRRGAGKSSLLLYALRIREKREEPSLWVDMQQYANRRDLSVVAHLLFEMLRDAAETSPKAQPAGDLLSHLERLLTQDRVEHSEIQILLPEIRTWFSRRQPRPNLVVFLDDLHLIDQSLQPRLLGDLYAIFRGNNVFMKMSAIETFTRTWDPQARHGLEIPHDLQTITLDYNLTMPDKATDHLKSILDAHAHYCGIPSIRNLCTSSDVLSRLAWVAAGVPRDGLNLFSQAMTTVGLNGRRHVSVSSVNVASSVALTLKLRDLEHEAALSEGDLRQALERIKRFVLEKSRKNAFLVEVTTSEPFEIIRKLVNLRLLHVISEGISIGKAGRKHIALVLDYGFYTGIRTARTVDLFNRQTTRVNYRDLRKLPVLHDLVSGDVALELDGDRV